MEDLNGSFKKKKVYFSQVSNSALRDKELSLKAKGLYCLIQSYITLEDFVLYKATLKKNCGEGLIAFESAWSELKKAGYLIQTRHQSTKGKFSYEYDLLDVSIIIHTLKTKSADNLHSGKHRVYNNTDLSNTDINNTNLSRGDEIKYNKGKNGKLTTLHLEVSANMAQIEVNKTRGVV